MNIFLGGHLNYYNRDKGSWISYPLETPLPLRDILHDLKIPKGEVQLVVINGQLQDLDAVVSEEDEIKLFSPVGGG